MSSPSRRTLLGSGLVGAATALMPVSHADATDDDAGPDARWQPDEGQTFAVPGLDQPVRVTVDTWGVPHIFAATVGDLFQAQGFTIARDRLFQIDTWRRRGLGLLGEVLGPDHVEQDRAARLFLYRGDMAAEWASYGPEAREVATRFVAGINAYIDWLDSHPEAVPEEFGQLGYQPARWEPEDAVRIRTHGLSSSLSAKVAQASLIRVAGLEGTSYQVLEPEHTVQVPDGLDPSSIPADVLQVYNLATAPVTFTNGTLRPLPDELRSLVEHSSGSNAWAISPERTATGRPILAGDPHRSNHAVPANRYIVHLSAPGLNIIGAGEPWNPGISMGHNGHVAFGLTNLPADQSDLYVYDLDPQDPTRYRYLDGWERIRTVTEEVPVAGGEPRQVELSFTRHGPVIRIDAENHRAYAVRTVWSEPGTSPYLGSLILQRTRNFGEFSEAMRAWKTPGSNLVYADVHGDIGWVPGALLPRRTGRGFDGLLPAPGDGRYEWDGFYDQAELPSTLNPRSGFFASANEHNFPPGYPIPAYRWLPPYRKNRIDELLASQPSATIEGTLAIQNDEVSGVVGQLLPHLAELSPDDLTTRQALELLLGHDGVVDVDSAAAALFETWSNYFLSWEWARTLLSAAAADLLVTMSVFDFRLVSESLAHPEEWFGEGGTQVRDRLLLDTLSQAYAEVSSRLGDDPSRWRWGAMHLHQFTHPLGGPNVGPVEKGGSFHTIRASSYDIVAFPYFEVVGPTFRMALDVGDWDNSRALNAPGQSGDRRSPHYSDLHEKWLAGGSFPLLYSNEKIEQNAGSRILLQPS